MSKKTFDYESLCYILSRVGKSKEYKSSKDFMETLRKRFKLAEEAEYEVRKESLDDLKFRAGEQWPESVKRDREHDNRPCLIINRIPQFIRQITNDQRQNRPSIKVRPVDDKGDIDTAKIMQGMIRHIEYNSGADEAYDTAFEGAATKGFGYFCIRTDYVDPMSFEQEILIDAIDDDFSVYLDPNSKKSDGSDAAWGFIFEHMPKEDYIAEYGESDLASMTDWMSLGENMQDWVQKDTVRIAEYFYREYKKEKLHMLKDGGVIKDSKLKELYPDGDFDEDMIENTRETRVPVIKWCKVNGMEVLEETVWPGKWIPIIPVYGDKLIVEGVKKLEGVIRHAKDSQRMYNYWASSETETIALAPRAPFMVAEGQIPKEYEKQWASANRKNHAFLPYRPTSHSGQLAPPPQRQVYEPPVQGITNARMLAAEDLKATTGIYDAALGNRSNESSGIAIQRRAHQAQTSNFHLIDNLTRSIRHAGRIVVDLIPKIYDTPRAARIIGEEGEEEVVRINEEFEKQGEEVLYQMGVGKYDVVVDTGPSFATKRQEAAASMADMSRAYPQLMQAAGDLMVKNMDWPGSSEIAERLKKLLPPELAENPDKKPLPPEVQSQMQQMNQMIEQLTEQLKSATDQIEKKTLELESKERIEFAKMETDLEKEKLKQSQQFALEHVNRQIADLERRQQQVGSFDPISGQPDIVEQPNGAVPPDQSMEY